MEGFTMLFMYYFLFSVFKTTSTLDILTPGQSITDKETLVSADGSFELGFFSPDNSSRFLGIWFKKISIRTVVWVANRDAPISDSSGVLHIAQQGILLLQNGTNDTIWASNASITAGNPVAQLLDSGNLVVKDDDGNNPDNILWQSFDYPSNTLLSGMKVGVNLVTGFDIFLSSWKSTNDPSQGDFSGRVDPRGFPQVLIMKGSMVYTRGGPWNGLGFAGTPQVKPNRVYTFEFKLTESEVYYRYKLETSSVLSRVVLNESGAVQRYSWINRTQNWELFSSVPNDNCDNYALCGAHGSCNINNDPVCNCLRGFVPKFLRDWNLLDWSGGCVRRTELDCENGDGFRKYIGLKLPDTSRSWYNISMSLKECEGMCLKNCSCTAYANTDIRAGGSGCLHWFGDLIDMRDIIGGGQDLYIRLAASELDDIEPKKRSNEKREVEIAIGCLIVVMGMLILVSFLYIQKKKSKQNGTTNERKDCEEEVGEEDMELPTFDLATIVNATDNFSISNKLGEGGFGPVYKGTLIDGREIAVKRLSRSSGQGLTEFKNEVILISKLQHRNLVKLHGCVIQAEEKMLIYEFMPNKSLDLFLFDHTRSKLLNWHKRFHIIDGIARGLLYLHQDSRLRIIHRDLKASNVLLDGDLNPKISDFGVARAFGGDLSEENTNRVVGTYGYISPEYAVDGIYSVKSDVFSYGVIILEIVSGKRNRGFHHSDHGLNLLGHAWKLWIENRPMDLVNEFLTDFCVPSEVLRCIHVGLLCVQQLPDDRPNMSSVIVMLTSENSLPQPKQPGFYTERNPLECAFSSSKLDISSINEITTTLLEPR